MPSNREERNLFIEVLATLKEKQKAAKVRSVKLDKLTHSIELYVRKLYRDVTVYHTHKDPVDNFTTDSQ